MSIYSSNLCRFILYAFAPAFLASIFFIGARPTYSSIGNIIGLIFLIFFLYIFNIIFFAFIYFQLQKGKAKSFGRALIHLLLLTVFVGSIANIIMLYMATEISLKFIDLVRVDLGGLVYLIFGTYVSLAYLLIGLIFGINLIRKVYQKVQ